jgi:hypothetical protein
MAVGVTAIGLVTMSLHQILAAVKLPQVPRAMDRQEIRARFISRFIWIVALEITGIVATNIAADSSGHLSLLVPLDMIIIGIHFFPLARLFGVPR